MYYGWSWWWFVSFVIPMVLIAWIIFGYNSGRPRSYRGSSIRDRDDWDDRAREEREMRRPENRGRGPLNYRRSDERILEEVCDRLAEDDRVDASAIEVHVLDASVLLQGSVATRAERRVAEVIAETTTGVSDVRTELRIGMLTPSARTGAPQPSVPAGQT